MFLNPSREKMKRDEAIFLPLITISTWLSTLAFIVMGLMLLTSPVSATNSTITASDVSQYSLSASPGFVIYQIIVDNLPMGTNQTHVLNSNGAQFFLEIDSKNSFFIYNEFWITMTYPNGSTSTIHKTTTRISGSQYKTTIQPVFTQIQSMTNVYWTVDLQVGIAGHVSAEFNSPPADNDLEGSIPFSSVSGEFSGVTTNVYAEEMSLDDFKNNVQNYNPAFGVGNLASQVLGWSWDMALGFINMVPVIGPQLVQIITIVGNVGLTILFWLWYIATNIWLIIGAGEILLIVFAFLMAGKRPKPERFVKNLIQYNIRSVAGFFYAINTLYRWLLPFVELIARIIRG
jgi:hypothetical protein